jgi:hypothetical protein
MGIIAVSCIGLACLKSAILAGGKPPLTNNQYERLHLLSWRKKRFHQTLVTNI